MKSAANTPHSLRVIPWPMTTDNFYLYLTYASVLNESEPGSDAFETAIEGLKMLPNYPGPSSGDSGAFYQPVITNATQAQVH